MTIDEAIKHCEEVAEEQNKLCERCDRASGYSRSHNESIRTDEAKKHEKCGFEHLELAAWLRELKALKAEPVLDKLRAEIRKLDDINPDYPMDRTVHVSRNEVLQIIDKYKAEREV